MLLDSNVVIYAFDPAHKKVVDFLRGRAVFVSALTQIEVLGFWRLSDEEYRRFVVFFAAMDIIAVTPDVIEGAIALRRKRSMGLADAVIAASALVRRLPLATHNTRDFQWVEGLELVDPIGEAHS